MAYNLYTDKPTKFNCNIDIEGTSLSKSKARVIVETEDMSYMFNGTIESNGLCEVHIPKTKNFLPEGTKGNIRLEVIADDVYFEPWSSDLHVKTNKKVAVVVQEQEEERPKLKVQVFEQQEEKQKPKIVESVKPKINTAVKPNTVKKKEDNTLSKEEFIRQLMSRK